MVIVGAGPTGLSLAAELLRLGISPMVLDRLDEGANTSRAAVVHARTLEVLRPLCVTEQLLANGVIVPTFRVRDRDRILMTISFKDLETEFPFTLMCPQNRTEAILLDRVNALGGVVRRPCEVVSARQHTQGVEITYRSGGALEKLEAKWLVGCDGGQSVVRKQAGIGFEGDTYPESFVLGDVEMDWPLGRDEVSLFFSEQGLVVVAPLPEGHFRIVATVEHADESPSLADFALILKKRGPETEALRIKEIVWSSRFRVSHRVATSFRRRNILLAGDAAHVHSPAGGQGMNTGIQDAVSLAEALAKVLRVRDDVALEEWESKRRKIAEGVVTLTDRITRAATASSPMAKLLRNTVIDLVGHLPFANAVIARRISELDNK